MQLIHWHNTVMNTGDTGPFRDFSVVVFRFLD